MYPINKISSEIQEINFQGNIIPASWKNHLRLGSCIDLVSLYLLSELVYWYRPICTRDINGNEVYHKKYQGDFLQKSYSQLENSLGLSKKQLQDSIERLEKKGLIKRHFRTIHIPIPGSTDTRPCSNILYIEIFPNKIKEITYSELKKVIPYTPTGDEGSTHGSIGVFPQVYTYTETTITETTPEIKGNVLDDDKTLPLIDDDKTLKKCKHPLKKEQKPYFEKMKNLQLGSDEETLIILVREAFKKNKILELEKAISHIQAERVKGTVFKKAPIALFRSVLNGKISPISENVKINKKYAEQAKQKGSWDHLEIHDKFLKCSRSNAEVRLDQDSKDFKLYLKNLYDLGKNYAT